MQNRSAPRRRYYDVQKEAWVDYNPLGDGWVSPDDPAPEAWEAPMPGVWSGRPRNRRNESERLLLKWGLVVLGFGLLAAADAFRETNPGLIGVLSVVTVLVGLAILAIGTGPVAMPEDLRMLEDPSDQSSFLVEVRLSVDGKVIGRDRGVLWFFENAMFFSGYACSFCIATQDVLPYSHSDDERILIRLKPSEEDHAVSLESVWRRDWRKQAVTLYKTVSEFLKCDKPSTVPRQYPPLTPPPE
jgi:hypothetical protein